MDGYLAPLEAICDLAEKHDALVMVDDSHAVGFMGATGAGTPEHAGVSHRVDIYTGTFGKALGGASGGYVSGRSEVVAMLRQKARPYLFSNSLAPAIVAATIKALDLVEKSGELRTRLFENAELFRRRMTEEGFELLDGEHAIVPVMFGDAVLAAKVADQMLQHGVFVTAFSFPVVPRGAARIRVQLSAAHSATTSKPASGRSSRAGTPWPGSASRQRGREDAELVALRVGEAHPRHVALADVGVSGAEGPQPGHLCRLIVTGVRHQVEMDTVPHGLHAGRAKELQIRPDALGRTQPRMIVVHLVQGPVRSLAPEPGHGPRIRAVDHHRGDRPGVPVDRPRLQHTEHIALRVGQDGPWHIALAHICVASHRAPTGARPAPPGGPQRWWRDRGARGTSRSRGPGR